MADGTVALLPCAACASSHSIEGSYPERCLQDLARRIRAMEELHARVRSPEVSARAHAAAERYAAEEEKTLIEAASVAYHSVLDAERHGDAPATVLGSLVGKLREIFPKPTLDDTFSALRAELQAVITERNILKDRLRREGDEAALTADGLRGELRAAVRERDQAMAGAPTLSDDVLDLLIRIAKQVPENFEHTLLPILAAAGRLAHADLKRDLEKAEAELTWRRGDKERFDASFALAMGGYEERVKELKKQLADTLADLHTARGMLTEKSAARDIWKKLANEKDGEIGRLKDRLAELAPEREVETR